MSLPGDAPKALVAGSWSPYLRVTARALEGRGGGALIRCEGAHWAHISRQTVALRARVRAANAFGTHGLGGCVCTASGSGVALGYMALAGFLNCSGTSTQ